MLRQCAALKINYARMQERELILLHIVDSHAIIAFYPSGADRAGLNIIPALLLPARQMEYVLIRLVAKKKDMMVVMNVRI